MYVFLYGMPCQHAIYLTFYRVRYGTRPFYGECHARIKTHAQQAQKFLSPNGALQALGNKLSTCGDLGITKELPTGC